MGLLDFFRRRPSPGPAAAAVVEARPAPPTPTAPTGVSGTTNYSGRLQVERNEKLRDQLAYGRAGTTEWGEWEEIRRTNPWVAAAIAFVLAPIEDADVEVKPGTIEESVTPELQQHADFVRWNLTEALEPEFQALRTRALDGMLTSGFSLFEFFFAQNAEGRWYVPTLEERLPSSLSAQPWKENPETGELDGVEQMAPGPGGQWRTTIIPTSQLLRFTWEQTGKNYAGFSAFRGVWYIAARIQPELLRLIGVTYQREGAGVPVAQADDPTTPLTPDQRAQFEELLANLVYHENASAILPPGWKMNWIFSGGMNKGHVLECWKQLGIVVLQQLGAQQLALGTGDTGSRSVGEVHDARAAAYVRKGARAITAVYSQLARRIVEVNFGPQKVYPKVVLTLKRPEMKAGELADAMAKGKQGGLLTITIDDENALRDRLGLRPIEEGEREAAIKEAREAATAIAGGEEPKEPGDGEEPTGKRPLKASAEWEAWRPLRASEKRTDWPRIDQYLASRREAFERAVKPVVVEMLVRAAPDITAAMADGDPAEVATLKLDTSRLEEAVGAFLDGVRQSGGAFARVELKSASPEKLAEARRSASLTAASGSPTAEDDADEILDAQEEALVRRMTNRLRTELETEALDVLRTGGNGFEVVSRTVARQLETGAFRTDAGAVVARIFNVGRDEAARMLGGVSRVEYSAVLDSRVCSSCRNLDGRQADFGSAEHDALVPPNRDCDGGANCRCLLVYVPEEE